MFRLTENNGIKYYKIDSFEESGAVRHCFTTRFGGVSSGEFSSMNFRTNCADTRENVLKNYEIICGEVGIDINNLVLSKQIHENNVVRVGASDRGNGILYENKFKSADGLITDEPGVALVTSFADCVPIFFFDPKKRVIALVHSGWKGTVKNIAGAAVSKFGEYGSASEDIIAAIGPSIGKCCFEVGDDVAEIFTSRFGGRFAEKQNGRYHVDLRLVIRSELVDAGVKGEKITVADICTACNSELLFSHRKTGGRRGNMAAFLELK